MAKRFDIIIVGAGLSGAFSALWLSKNQKVLLVEALHRPSGASQVAAGIVNPFTGLRGRLMWRGLEALEGIDALVTEAGAERLYNRCGVLRPSASAEQSKSFRNVARTYPGYAAWIGADEARHQFAGVITDRGALLLHGGGIIDTPQLIEAVLSSAARRGAIIKTGAEVVSWGSANNSAFVVMRDKMRYEASRVLLCLGSGYIKFSALRVLNLHRTKGQIVRVRRPVDFKLPMPVSGRGYVVPDSHALLVGTTYERGFATEEATEEATRTILRNAAAMVPDLKNQPVLATTAGVRVGVPGTRLPIVGPITERIWVFTGLGSKGILFSALVSRMLPTLLEDPAQIPHAIQVTKANSK